MAVVLSRCFVSIYYSEFTSIIVVVVLPHHSGFSSLSDFGSVLFEFSFNSSIFIEIAKLVQFSTIQLFFSFGAFGAFCYFQLSQNKLKANEKIEKQYLVPVVVLNKMM